MFENNFPSRRGQGLVGRPDAEPYGFYLYDNNPYANDPQRRGREYAELIAYLETRGAKLVEEASYPRSGTDAGYTTAHVFHANNAEELMHAARDRHFDIVHRSMLHTAGQMPS
jgi:hypothetical protein